MALLEIADGVRSTVEADLRKLVKRSKLPDPLYNPRLYAGHEFIAMPDAWWPEAGVAVEIDSRQWHLSPADWERTMARHSRMSAVGITVLHYPPSKLHAEPKVVIAEIGSALDIGRSRPQLPIRTQPAN
jgi:very-short-patch-repair endonuclease